MVIDLTRRSTLLGGAAAMALPFAANATLAAPAPADVAGRLAALETASRGRLGVAALDTGSGQRVAYRADERFPMLSTFKFLAAALVLSRVDAGKERLERRVFYSARDLVPYSPTTKDGAGDAGLTVAQICEAAVTLSDNTAGNLMLASFGGPAALTDFARTLGDDQTRLDRTEPTLNEAKAGDLRDTTTPAAMLGAMNKLLLGEVLSAESRRQLDAWLLASKTGAARLSAGFPKGWRVGDKTGTGENGSAADIAIAWPHDAAPKLAAAYFVGPGSADERSAIFAQAAAILSMAG